MILLPVLVQADPRVSVVGTARPEYTERKFRDGRPVAETYVIVQGSYFDGLTVDRSIERMPFRRIAETIALHLARENFLPTREVRTADLAIVVHWGTTWPYLATQTMSGSTSAMSDNSGTMGSMAADYRTAMDRGASDAGMEQIVAMADLSAGLPTDAANQLEIDNLNQSMDQLGARMNQASNVALLGYGAALSELSKAAFGSAEETSLRFDLMHERYFIVLKAYDLRHPPPAGQPNRPVWTLHLNMGSAGVNFGEAMARMSDAAPQFAGRTTGAVKTVNRPAPAVKVELAPLIILGEVK